jgi:hypothetical protein
MNPRELVSKSKVFKVEFIKKNGDTRVMLASNKPDIIAKFIGESTAKNSTRVNPDVCTVLDLEKQEFRCFRWDSVKHIEIIK